MTETTINETLTMEPLITRRGALDLQVCIPAAWSDDQVREFANREVLCGTTNGWQIRKEGSPRLDGFAERVACARRGEFVHVMLEA
jgi:hypothetical protein